MLNDTKKKESRAENGLLFSAEYLKIHVTVLCLLVDRTLCIQHFGK